MKAKRKTALRDWDRRREAEGLGKWDVIFRTSIAGIVVLSSFYGWAVGDPSGIDTNVGDSYQHEVKSQTRKSPSIHIPVPSSTWASWPLRSDSDKTNEWDESITALFEWVGMACLGAQRYVQSNTTLTVSSI
jgi:ribonuclease P/MRP protein subunit RPP40